MRNWIAPTLLYVVVLGGYGVTAKLALREFSWQELMIWTTGAYLLVSLAFLATGTSVRFRGGQAGTMAAISAFAMPAALVGISLALRNGEAKYVIPLSTAYPLVTLVLAALVLAEPLTLRPVLGAALIIAGAVVVAWH